MNTLDSESRKTPKEVAEHYGIGPATVRNWQRAGCPFLYAGRMPRFLLSEVEAWLRGRHETAKVSTRKAA